VFRFRRVSSDYNVATGKVDADDNAYGDEREGANVGMDEDGNEDTDELSNTIVSFVVYPEAGERRDRSCVRQN